MFLSNNNNFIELQDRLANILISSLVVLTVYEL